MKRSDKENITTIIHDLKLEYSRVFREKFPMNDSKMEQVLNSAAKEVKQKKFVKWSFDKDGNKSIVVSDRY